MAKVLVADDDAAMVMMLTDIVKSLGHEVFTARDGREMVSKTRELQPQLILADIMMPGMNGPAAFEILGKDPATNTIPVIFLTAALHDKAEGMTPKSPRVRLLFKPLHLPTLAQTMDELLAG